MWAHTYYVVFESVPKAVTTAMNIAAALLWHVVRRIDDEQLWGTFALPQANATESLMIITILSGTWCGFEVQLDPHARSDPALQWLFATFKIKTVMMPVHHMDRWRWKCRLSESGAHHRLRSWGRDCAHSLVSFILCGVLKLKSPAVKYMLLSPQEPWAPFIVVPLKGWDCVPPSIHCKPATY